MRYDNECYHAERDESRSARRSMSEVERARTCRYPMSPCSCGTCDMRGDW